MPSGHDPKGLGRISIGRITAPQGLSGEVRVTLLTDFPERYQPGIRVFVEHPPDSGSGAWKVITSVRPRKQGVVVGLEGVDSRNAAAALADGLLQVEPEDRHPLPDDHFYVDDLVGMPVVLPSGQVIGRALDVLPGAAQDLLRVGALPEDPPEGGGKPEGLHQEGEEGGDGEGREEGRAGEGRNEKGREEGRAGEGRNEKGRDGDGRDEGREGDGRDEGEKGSPSRRHPRWRRKRSRKPAAREALIPLVKEFLTIDPGARCITVHPIPGLLDGLEPPDETGSTGGRGG